MFKLKTLAAAAAVSALPAIASAAILDDFSTDQVVADAPASGFPATNTVGNRTFTVDNRAGNATFASSLSSGGDSDVLDFSNQANINGFATVLYDFGAGADFSNAGGFAIDFLTLDIPNKPLMFDLAVNGITASRTLYSTDAGSTLYFARGEFGGVDFSSVQSIFLTIDAENVASADPTFDNLRTTPVPVPAAGLLLLGGLGALGAVKRRKG